jgi:hypothetical protein
MIKNTKLIVIMLACASYISMPAAGKAEEEHVQFQVKNSAKKSYTFRIGVPSGSNQWKNLDQIVESGKEETMRVPIKHFTSVYGFGNPALYSFLVISPTGARFQAPQLSPEQVKQLEGTTIELTSAGIKLPELKQKAEATELQKCKNRITELEAEVANLKAKMQEYESGE